MTGELVILLLLIVTAVAFDFTNGFHDTGNAMATSIATKALRPKAAVTLAAIMNLIGAFLSVEVAITVTTSVLRIQDTDSGALISGLDGATAMSIVFAGLVGGIIWNLATWLFGLPSSSSHALFGGLVGAGLAAMGTLGINWSGLLAKVIIPALLSPFIACAVAACGSWLVFRVTRGIREKERDKGFRVGQIATASLVSLAHGTGDAQKTMGVIALGLIAHGSLTTGDIEANGLPAWIILLCGGAIALGTYLGGWRIIRTLGKGITDLNAPQGFAADASSAAIILTSSHMGMALSTTHVATGSIVGSGVGRPGGVVRWATARRMVSGWLLTLPAAAIMGAAVYGIGHLVGGVAGAIVEFAILVALAGYMYYRSTLQKVDHTNVTDEWDGTEGETEPESESETRALAGVRTGTAGAEESTEGSALGGIAEGAAALAAELTAERVRAAERAAAVPAAVPAAAERAAAVSAAVPATVPAELAAAGALPVPAPLTRLDAPVELAVAGRAGRTEA